MPLFRTYRRVKLALPLLLALMFSQSAHSAGTDPIPSATTVTVSVTLTGKDANGVPFVMQLGGMNYPSSEQASSAPAHVQQCLQALATYE